MFLSVQNIAWMAVASLQLSDAYPQDLPGHDHVWKAAGAGDLRSPCPALNTAANIGYLPRSGSNLTAEMLATAVVNIYNVDPSFAKTLAEQGFSGVAAKGAKHITLADLSKHDAVEHDASLTRKDEKQGDNHSVQKDLVEALIADAAPSTYLSIATLAKSRARRERESKAAGSPALSLKATTLAYGEAALVLQTLGHLGDQKGKTGFNVPAEAVRQWMGKENLPDGWTKPPKAITSSSTSLLAAEILALAKTLGESTPAVAKALGGSRLAKMFY
jgi:hypothetical protein